MQTNTVIISPWIYRIWVIEDPQPMPEVFNSDLISIVQSRELDEQETQEWNWFLELCGKYQRLLVRVILPTVRMAARWTVLHLRSAPRWRPGRWRAKT